MEKEETAFQCDLSEKLTRNNDCLQTTYYVKWQQTVTLLICSAFSRFQYILEIAFCFLFIKTIDIKNFDKKML